MTPRGAAERKRKWGGARLAMVAGVERVEATAWRVSGGGSAAGPALAAVPAVGARPAGWQTPASVCQRFLCSQLGFGPGMLGEPRVAPGTRDRPGGSPGPAVPDRGPYPGLSLPSPRALPLGI
ncbi:unnamed protein product [Rangifer tarandus platyrhynchus]|uniref:Uncharacterized protein n=1 Tax=Rangifer tarandus platyrhynchus TaxID=3082113 RepID=A0AC59ZLU2_RANTA